MSQPNTPAPAAPEAVEPVQPEASAQEEVVESEQPEVVEAAESKEEKPASAKTLKKLKYKFKEQEVEEDLPFEIPDSPEATKWLQNQLSLAKLGHVSAQEKAQLQKELAEFVEAIRSNPRAVLSDPTLGVDLKKLAAEILQEEIENSKKSPEQLEKEKLERELKALKDAHDKEKKAAEERERAQLTKQSLAEYNHQIDEALKNSSLPKSQYVTKKIAEQMLIALRKGVDVSVADVLPIVEAEVQKDIQDMFSVMPEDVVQKIIGKEKLTNIRKKAVAKAKDAPPPPLNKAVKDVGGKVEAKKEDKKQSYRQFFGV